MPRYSFCDLVRKSFIYAYCTPLGFNRDQKNKVWRQSYRKRLAKYVPSNINTFLKSDIESKFVFTCWLQGYEAAPEIVKRSIDSIKKNAVGKEVVIISRDNLNDYIDIPSFIQVKWEKGLMSDAHFSDILRVLLLFKYGGLWVDATVMLFGPIPSYIEESSLFFFKSSFLSSESPSVSNWLIFSRYAHNSFIAGLRESLFNYWRVNNSVPDYYMFHDFVTIMSKIPIFKRDWDKIPYYENTTPHLLQHELLLPYKKRRFDQILCGSSVQKLTYKYSCEKSQIEKTNLFHILNDV